MAVRISSVSPEQLRRSLRYHRLTERLHQLGARPLGEALLEVAAGADPVAVLERYPELDPAAVARLGARNWPPVPLGCVA